MYEDRLVITERPINLIGAGRAPGMLRTNFGMQHVKGFPREEWEALRRELQKRTRKHARPMPIIASDIDAAGNSSS